MAVLLVMSMGAMSTVAAGVATANTEALELSVDETDSIDTSESAEFEANVTNSGEEEVTTDVVFEINGQEASKEVTVGTGETKSVTFYAEGYVFDEGEYDWSVTAGEEEDSGTLTVGDTDEETADEEDPAEGAKEGGTDEDADNESASDDGTDDENSANENATDEDDADNETADEEGADDETTDEENADNETTDEGDDEGATNEETDDEDDGMPGFGAGVALVALLAAAMLTLRRER